MKERIVAFVVVAEKKTLGLAAETAEHVAEDAFVADAVGRLVHSEAQQQTAVGRLVHIFERENSIAFALDMFEVAFAEVAAQLVGGPLGAGRPEMGLEEILVEFRRERESAHHLGKKLKHQSKTSISLLNLNSNGFNRLDKKRPFKPETTGQCLNIFLTISIGTCVFENFEKTFSQHNGGFSIFCQKNDR